MIKISYLGPEHTNTHWAARKHFGSKASYHDAPTIEEVFHAVERRKVDYGVVPIENSLGGAVIHTLDRFIDFIDTPVKIQGEIEQAIQHYLITQRRAELNGINIIYSHPQAFTQCRHWLEKNLPHATLRERDSTAEAVQYMLNKETTKLFPLKERAAIGPKELAKKYKLEALSIPQEADNRTRFLILGLAEVNSSQRNKTSILIALKDQPGALYDALAPFKSKEINLTKIESRPSKRKTWEYYFFIDLEGHKSDPKIQQALEELKASVSLFRVLGSYPVNS